MQKMPKNLIKTLNLKKRAFVVLRYRIVSQRKVQKHEKGNVRSQNTRIRCEFAWIPEQDGIKLHDTNWCDIVPHQNCTYVHTNLRPVTIT